jgi:hypothetical protein
MAYLRTSEISEILEDFYTNPLYSGKGLWEEIFGTIRSIKDNSLTGILVLKRMGETLVSFYDSGNFLEGISFEGDRFYTFNYDDFLKGVSASSRVRPYSYDFHPHNSEVIAIISLIHRGGKVMESITPYLSRIFGDLKNLGFSGVLRIKSPKLISIIFLSGSPAGAFSKGKSVNLKESLKDGEVYEMYAYSVEGPLMERTYAYHLKNFLPRLNGIYRKMIKDDKNVARKVRKIMLKYAEEEPYLDPMLGFVEINGEIRINLEPYGALKTLYLLCDVLEEANKRFSSEIEKLRGGHKGGVMRWFLAILLFSIFTFFLTILGIFEFWRLEGERERAFKVMSLRENLAYILSYYGKDEALLRSHLNLSKNLALEIGDEGLISLLDSLERGVRSKTFKDKDLMGFTEKIKKRTEGIITGGRNARYWLYALFIALFSILASIISVLGFLEMRRNLGILKKFLSDLRLGILWERLELGGDFKVLEEELNGLIRDVKRVRRNVQKVVRS